MRMLKWMRGAVYTRVAVGLLTMSSVGFATWKASEHFVSEPMIPTKNDAPTIGFGSTRYEDGTPVKLTDPPITRKRAEQLARNLNDQEEIKFIASLPGVELTQEEFDLYMDFVGQYGIGNWRKSAMRRHLLAGNHKAACEALLRYRFAAGYDCSTRINGKPNKRCWGVWQRQLARCEKCREAQK